MTAITISLRVTAPGAAAARVSVGRRQFSFGRPVEFDDASPYVAALEYALGAVGGEVVNGLREFARRRRLPIDAVEALVTGEPHNGLAYLEVIGETGRPRIRRIAIKVFVGGRDRHSRAVRRDDRTPPAGIVTDGELRRDNFYSFVAEKLSGARLMTLAEMLDVVEDKAGFEQLLQTLDVPAYSAATEALRTYLERLEVTQLVLEYATERAGTIVEFEGKEIGWA
jgi:hypothetical protein